MTDASNIAEQAKSIAEAANKLAESAANLVLAAPEKMAELPVEHTVVDPFIFGFTVFILACFVGYYVVWSVTPALHTPLMSVTNAISGIIIVGAIIAAGPELFDTSKILGFFAVLLASINIFGGFIVTQRMLHMFKKK